MLFCVIMWLDSVIVMTLTSNFLFCILFYGRIDCWSQVFVSAKMKLSHSLSY